MSDALTRIRKHVERWERTADELNKKAKQYERPVRSDMYTRVDVLRGCASDVRRVLERSGETSE
jgi:hypothetical protein